jgi:hypothetical protein
MIKIIITKVDPIVLELAFIIIIVVVFPISSIAGVFSSVDFSYFLLLKRNYYLALHYWLVFDLLFWKL